MTDIDEKITEGILNGDEFALELLIDKYGGLIKSIVYYHLKYFPEYREECMQDIFLAIWRNIKSYNADKNSLKNWIGAVSKYKCIDYKRKYYKEICFEELDESVAGPESFAQNELAEEIESILNCLDKDDRELFYRHYILGEKICRIAKSKDKSSAFFYNRLSRGREKIRRSLQRSGSHEK